MSCIAGMGTVELVTKVDGEHIDIFVEDVLVCSLRASHTQGYKYVLDIRTRCFSVL